MNAAPTQIQKRKKKAADRKRQRDAIKGGRKPIPGGTLVDIDTFEALVARAETSGITFGEVIDAMVNESQIEPEALSVMPDLQEALCVDTSAEVIGIVITAVAANNPILQTIKRRTFGDDVACDTGDHRHIVQSPHAYSTSRLKRQ